MNKFKLWYPPRPANAIPSEAIVDFDNNKMFAQAKLNGSQGVLYIDENHFEFRNRHKELLSNVKIDSTELSNLHRGCGQMILCGEYLNKNKKHINDKDFNHKYVIFDIIMFNNEHLIGKTFKQRQDILDVIYKTENFDGYIDKLVGFDNVYRVKNFYSKFTPLFKDLVKIDLYEGIVMKDINSKLEYGFVENNNSKNQVKSRKSTKNYSF